MKAWLVCGLWGLMAMAHAQPSEDVPQVLAKERAALALQRHNVAQNRRKCQGLGGLATRAMCSRLIPSRAILSGAQRS